MQDAMRRNGQESVRLARKLNRNGEEFANKKQKAQPDTIRMDD